MNYAYVTLLSSIDFLPAAIITDRNLKELESQYPLYVMVTEDIYNEVINYLNNEHINVIKVPVISYSDITLNRVQNDRLAATASKINIFSLHQFDKIVYLDLDQVFIATADNLFNFPDGSLYDDGGESSSSGILVCNPPSHNIEFYKVILNNFCLLDGDLLDTLWFPYKTDQRYHIPIEYSLNILAPDFEELYCFLPKLYGLHFCGDLKPWNFSSSEKYKEAFYEDYPTRSLSRDYFFDWYFKRYINPLREQYPEIFIER